MSIYGRRKTTLGFAGILARVQGREALHLMINLELSLQIAGSFLGDLCNPSTPVPPSQIAQQGDGDIILVITVRDGNTGQPADISAATLLAVLIQKPDLTSASYPASLTTNGRDGRISVPLGPTDLGQAGYYFVQALFSIGAVAKSTVLGEFIVGENIIPDPLPLVEPQFENTPPLEEPEP